MEPHVFTTDYNEIIEQVNAIDPTKYAATRNFVDGAVTHLSPYISRGVISTADVLKAVQKKNLKYYKIDKFVVELAWRDYWQQVWIAKGELINEDLKQAQPDVQNNKMPLSIAEANTGIEAVDDAIKLFYKTGYLHNHMRMYIASIACNIAKSHWKLPAQWMYYHLLDGDWASNALSWQWMAGSNSSKKYYANQQNINKYWHSQQQNSFLDKEYKELVTMAVPPSLSETQQLNLTTELPGKVAITIDANLPTCLYNFYNLDPKWKSDIAANRILLLEPSIFKHYPVSKQSIDFALKLSENISGIQVFTGEYNELVKEYALGNIYYKEHPLNKHYKGIEESRDWMFGVKGYYASFFQFFKKCVKEMKEEQAEL